jgi:hypothetical protein
MVLGLGLAMVPSIGAHHSTSSMYEEGKTIELRGKIVAWRFVNPHPYLVVEVTNEAGVVEKWDFSFGGSAVVHLTRSGYSRDTFKVGETVVGRGAPSKSQAYKGILIRGNLTRPDGTRFP